MTFDNKPNKTYTFQPSTVAKASEVNQNFDDAFGIYDTNGFIYGGWYPLVGVHLQYDSATTVRTTTDVDLTGIIQSGDRLTFEYSNIPGVDFYYIVTEMSYKYVSSIAAYRTVITVHSVGADDGGYSPVRNEPIITGTVGFSRFVRPYGIPGVVFNGNTSNGLIEGKIHRSIDDGALLTKITTPSGEDPSPQSPVGVYIDGGIRYIYAETSDYAPDGTNHLNLGSAELAGKETDLFVYIRLVKASDALEHIISRVPYANRMGDFVNSGTNEKGAINIVSTYAAGDPVVLVGRFAATLSAGAGHTWTVPTANENTLVQRPIYETRVLNYQPVYSTSGSMTYTSIETFKSIYQIKNRTFYVSISARGTTGGTASLTLLASLPISLADSGNGRHPFAGGAAEPDQISCNVSNNGATQMRWIKTPQANWTLGTNRAIFGSGTAPIVEG